MAQATRAQKRQDGHAMQSDASNDPNTTCGGGRAAAATLRVYAVPLPVGAVPGELEHHETVEEQCRHTADEVCAGIGGSRFTATPDTPSSQKNADRPNSVVLF